MVSIVWCAVVSHSHFWDKDSQNGFISRNPKCPGAFSCPCYKLRQNREHTTVDPAGKEKPPFLKSARVEDLKPNSYTFQIKVKIKYLSFLFYTF